MKSKQTYGFFYRNGLSIAFVVLMILSWGGQIYTGWKEHNEYLGKYQVLPQSLHQYLGSGHFIEATFENWESEFLQMALFVLFTIWLRQQGSSESKKMEPQKENEEVPKANSPWPVKKGGVYLAIYRHSLSISLVLLYLFSFIMHAYGSWLDYNEQQMLESKSTTGFLSYFGSNKLWFESFQNWQSEFFSIFMIIFLSIYLREKGSSQSKSVNASYDHTGEE